MIVKDESAVIRRCLESVRSVIDYWVIVDTGSSDGTQSIVRESFKDIPGELHERPWVNFEHNRNEVLALAKGHGDYFLLIDADDWLVFRQAFEWPDLRDDYYLAAYHQDGSISQRILLIDSQFDWKWHGIIHEVIQCMDAKKEGVLADPIIRATGEGNRAKDLRKKFLSDVRILEQALEDDPLNKRYLFHLAISYAAVGEYQLALKYFKQRIARGDSTLEVFFCLYKKAQIERKLGFDPGEFIKSYIQAYLFRPTRAEPFFCLADYYIGIQCHILGYLFSKRALTISDSKDCYCRQMAVYDYGILCQVAECAVRVGQYQEAYGALKKILLAQTLPQDIREESEKKLALPVFDKFRNL
jgi:glycosyltransferase involved in cell wall biosynthesis